jgi:hypothetical protein
MAKIYVSIYPYLYQISHIHVKGKYRFFKNFVIVSRISGKITGVFLCAFGLSMF